ncbi:unnamed protein product [Trichogramma brassicae]|uniref:FH2 domain-containing protein n=1 Tax=Trichogramma brassicae TaxID=86971 RepID=A0A6H5J490_9HYME|nr:unnamed protein product [Trichogramma brassicae]
MDSHVGLDFIVDNPDYCHKLASALDTSNVRVKKQVVELLSALCVYSQDGRQRAIDTLDIYQNRKEARYRLLVVVNELGQAHDSEDYQTALLAFINCLVISAPGLKDRVRMRNEFIGLKLLPILNELRKEKNHVPELRVQLDVFDDQRDTDEVLANQGPPGIDLSSHVDVFYAILGQVADTPQEIAFLSLLQHLLRLDPKEPASDLAWDTAETLVHRATLLESREDATKLLRSPSLQTNLCCHCRTTDQMCGGGSSGLGVAASGGGSVNTTATASVSNPAVSGRKAPSSPAGLVPPPPPPPPAPLLQPKLVLPPPPPLPNFSVTAAAAPPPPPPPKMMMSMGAGGGGVGGSMGSGGNGGPPAPPPFMVPNNRLRTERLQLEPEVSKAPSPEPPNDAKLLPQQEIPTPRTKMKTINWNKIPNHKVIGKHNIWSVVANEHQNSPMPDLDWAEIESLFCQTSAATSANLTGFNNNTEIGKSRRESTEITLLHGKRSLNINIFLKQFRSLNMLITDLISDGAHDIVGGERLRGLLKILPEVDELEMLNNFQGDRMRLGPAEKFYLDLQQVPNYKLRIECMLLKEEFGLNLRYLKTNLSSMIQVGRNLMTNKPLQEVLYMVLIAGNFLNSGGYAGNAAGVKLSSLQKLTEIRANKPGMNLIHYVAMQAEKKNKDLLNFTQEMSDLETATKTTIEQVTNEFNALDSRIKKICSQIQLPTTEKDIQDQMAKFLEMSERELEQIKLDIDELDNVRRSLAEFFCEDANTFKVEECFKIFHQFCQKFTQAVADNKHRKLMEEQALARKKQRDEQGSTKKRMPEENLDMSTESEPKSPLFGKTNNQSRFIPDLTTTNKAREQELNDEGFEETQSLVSETLSQEASSGNYETDTHDSTRCSPAEMTRGGDTPKKSNPKLSTLPKVTQSAKSSTNSAGSTSKAPASSAAAFSRRDSSSRLAKAAAQDKTVGRLKQAFERRNSRDSVTSTRSSSSASKAVPADKGAIGNSSSYLPKRAASLKREPPTRMSSLDNPKRALPTSLRNHDPVERSASRSSLRSSRSSLNSSTSVNTVRNNKKHMASATTASKGPHLDRFSRPIRALAGDLARKNSAESNSSVDEKMTANSGTGVRRVATLRSSVSTTKIPASRSSSSGSSVGPAAKMIRKAVPVSLRLCSLDVFVYLETMMIFFYLLQTSSNASRESASNVRRRNVPSSTQQPTTGLLTNNKSTPSATTSKVSSVVARLTAPRGSSTGTQRSQSFMRPTAASVNKNTIAPLPKGIKTLVK